MLCSPNWALHPGKASCPYGVSCSRRAVGVNCSNIFPESEWSSFGSLTLNRIHRKKQVTTKQLGLRRQLCQHQTDSLPWVFAEDKHLFISDYSLTAGRMRAVFRDDIFFPLANPQTSSVCLIKITAVKELRNRFSLRALWFPVALALRTGIWLICGMRVGCIPWKSRQVRISIIVNYCEVQCWQWNFSGCLVLLKMQCKHLWQDQPYHIHFLHLKLYFKWSLCLPKELLAYFFSPYNKRKCIGQI